MLDCQKGEEFEPADGREEARGGKENTLKVQRHLQIVHQIKQNAQLQTQLVDHFRQKQLPHVLRCIFPFVLKCLLLSDFHHFSVNYCLAVF